MKENKKIKVYRLLVIILPIVSFFLALRYCLIPVSYQHARANKNVRLFRVACKWLRNYINGERIENILLSMGISEIAIFGTGELGKCLETELENSDIIIKYYIETYPTKEGVLSLEDELPMVDMIIVTPLTDYDQISSTLNTLVSTRIISIEDLIT